jgi:hypothetical protein
MAHPPKALKILDDYFLLPTGANIKFVHSLLGRVVENHVYPLQRYEPENIVPQVLVTGLMGNSNALESVTETTQLNATTEARARLTDLVRAHATKEQGSSATVSVYNLNTYDMTQIKPNFKKLMAIPEYEAAVRKLFNEVYEEDKRKRLPMITKVLVCEDVEVTTTEDSASGIGGKLTVPGTAAATHGTVPTGPLDGELEIDRTETKVVEKSKKISGGVVVGLAYTWTEIRDEPQEKKEKLKLMERIKSWFKPKGKNSKSYIVVTNNQFGGPFMFEGEEPDTPAEGKGSTTMGAGKPETIEKCGSSERTVHENDATVEV